MIKKTNKYYGAAFKVMKVSEPLPSSGKRLDSPDAVAPLWNEILENNPIIDDSKEHLIVITVDTRYQFTGYSLISVGTINESIAHPREILRPVIIAGAYGFILVHNHPSGDPLPSEADIRLTRRIAECADLLQIRILDHVIIGSKSLGNTSLKERGII